MNKLGLVFIAFLFACSSQQQTENTKNNDSIASSNNPIMPKGLSTDPAKLTALGVPVLEIIEKANSQEHLIPDDPKDDSLGYAVTGVAVVEGPHVTDQGGCANPGEVLFFVRSKYSQQQPEGMDSDGDVIYDKKYSFLTLAKNPEGGVFADHRVELDRLSGPFEFTVNVEDQFVLSPTCPVLAVNYKGEGGKDLPWRSNIITFYLFNGTEFIQVLELDLEKTYTLPNFSGEGGNLAYTELKTITALETTSHGLKNIKAHYTHAPKGGTPDEERDLEYRYDGAKYYLFTL